MPLVADGFVPFAPTVVIADDEWGGEIRLLGLRRGRGFRGAVGRSGVAAVRAPERHHHVAIVRFTRDVAAGIAPTATLVPLAPGFVWRRPSVDGVVVPRLGLLGRQARRATLLLLVASHH